MPAWNSRSGWKFSGPLIKGMPRRCQPWHRGNNLGNSLGMRSRGKRIEAVNCLISEAACHPYVVVRMSRGYRMNGTHSAPYKKFTGWNSRKSRRPESKRQENSGLFCPKPCAAQGNITARGCDVEKPAISIARQTAQACSSGTAEWLICDGESLHAYDASSARFSCVLYPFFSYPCKPALHRRGTELRKPALSVLVRYQNSKHRSIVTYQRKINTMGT